MSKVTLLVKLPKQRNKRLNAVLLGRKGGPMRDKRREASLKPDKRLEDTNEPIQ